ncbi:MAG: LysR family transcriptional regulator [Clostridia bacterium]
MLDFRHETFLTLYRIGNYTKSAEALHLTQPAVTQHIQYLERYYKCKLFYYKGKALQATPEAHKLFLFATAMRADSEKLRLDLESFGDETQSLVFGATLTIGEYIMPEIIKNLLHENADLDIAMQVGNTQTLLEKLRRGHVDFVLLEGFFNGADYASKLFMHAEFIPVCAAESEFAKGRFALNELLSARLITRENGSGTREVLEQVMIENNLSLGNFRRICEVGNIGAIKDLVAQNMGIAFLYKAACTRELCDGTLVRIQLSDCEIQRAFHFVYLKDSLRSVEFIRCFDLLRANMA